MLNHLLRQCEKDPKITSIYLHVQVSNDAALKFYEKFGFEITRYGRIICAISENLLEDMEREVYLLWG